MTYEIRDRPRKREKQLELSKQITTVAPDLADGKVLVLSGPEPELATRVYRDTGLSNDYILIDHDPSIFHSIQAQITEHHLNAQLIRDNIFTLDIPDGVNGIDLDLLGSLTYHRTIGVINVISRVKCSKFWLRLTTSHRALSTEDREIRLQTIRDGISQLGIDIIDEKLANYKETKKAPMICWQIICQRKQEKKMKKQKTLTQLPKAQQQMIRRLVRGCINTSLAGYTEKDISDAFGVNSRSLAAIKANITMDQKGVGPGRN